MRENDLLDLLNRAARAGARVTRRHFRGGVNAEEKSRGNLVSEVDRASERAIRRVISRRCPRASLLCEESGWQPGPDPVFIVDPLDGTTNYLRDVPCYAISIGVLARGRPLAGIILAPEIGLNYLAYSGKGAWRNGQRIRTRPRRLGPASLIAVPSVFGPRLLRASRTLLGGVKGKVRRLGSAALEMALVAEGAFDACLFDKTYLWDIAAGWLLVREAGGRCGLMGGGRLFPLSRQAMPGLAAPSCDPGGAIGRASLAIWASNGKAQLDLPWLAGGNEKRA